VSAFLVCGVSGLELDLEEQRELDRLRPGGVVLFARNVDGRKQLAELVGELRALRSRPYVAVDLEGGSVNRLRTLIGPLPSAAAAARAGLQAVRTLGAAAGAACAHFGIGADFAPVLDVAHCDGWLGAEARCLGNGVEPVRVAAEAFLGGLESYGVSACLKHYPGLGSGAVDSHRTLPVLDERVRDDRGVFAALACRSRAVMVAHALAPALGGRVPASLSAEIIGELRRLRHGPVIADDLEMGALAAYGSMQERAVAALRAGCDQVLVCNVLGERGAVVAHVREQAKRDPALARALRRAARAARGFGHGELKPVTWSRVQRLAERARVLAGEAA
jgi:beta-N-acetylhexosaminidase